MSILDIFNFKKAAAKIFTKENFALLRAVIREKIIEQVKKNIPGQEKMDAVMEAALKFIEEHLHSDNKIVQWCIDNLLIPNLRVIGQAIYDDLKEVVKGL